MTRHLAVVALAAVLASLGAATAILAAETAASPAVLTPPSLRLPGGARPVRYSLDLTLSPDRESFDGNVAIEVETDAPLTVLWLHATELAIGNA